MVATLEIRNLHASVDGDDDMILRGLNLTVKKGRDTCADGTEWLGQEHARQCIDGQPRL